MPSEHVEFSMEALEELLTVVHVTEQGRMHYNSGCAGAVMQRPVRHLEQEQNCKRSLESTNMNARATDQWADGLSNA